MTFKPPYLGDPPVNAEAESAAGLRPTKISHRQATVSSPIVGGQAAAVPADSGPGEQEHSDRVAYASLFAPSGRRRSWGLTYVCPVCGFGHFGRSNSDDAGGTRRSGCGRMIRVVIARTYRGRKSANE